MITRLKQLVIDRLGISRVAATADHADAAAGGAERRAAAVEDQLRSMHDGLAEAARGTAGLEQRLRIAECTAWAEKAPLRHRPTISVVMPTRDRRDLATHAIESVVAQTYDRWQLLVVDDGSTDDTPTMLAATADDDDRITIVRTDGIGAAGARNLGLDAATGDYVTFVDDDNVMHPAWLRGIAEYTSRVETCDAMFGAQLREDPLGDQPLPRLWFDAGVTTDDLRRANSIDLGALAVRRGHPELRFDESLDRYIDWEMIVRISDSTGIDPVPVISGCYTLRAAGGRISELDDGRLDAMRRRLARPAD
jgi:glycosyltransferase involved in cell wall biosynthesis